MGMNVNAQKLNLAANVEPVIINYNGIKVKAKKLTVHSEIPMSVYSGETDPSFRFKLTPHCLRLSIA